MNKHKVDSEIGVLLAAIVGLIIVMWVVGKVSCHARWSGLGYQVDHGLFAGCRIKVDNKWIPTDSIHSIRDIPITK